MNDGGNVNKLDNTIKTENNNQVVNINKDKNINEGGNTNEGENIDEGENLSNSQPFIDNSISCDYEEAFELTGHGRFNYVVLFACCFIFMYCSLEMAGLAYVITPAECDLNLTVREKSLVSSGIFIGIVATSICWGLASDHYGRRKVMLPTIIGTMIASFLSSICSAFWLMFPLRILTGALVSGPTATVLVYLSELFTNKKRDFALSMAITSDQINFVVLPGVAYAIISGTWYFDVGPLEIKPWRVFMWFWSAIGMTGAVILFFLPESPRFILATKGSVKTLPILAKIYAYNHGKKATDFPIGVIRTRSVIMEEQSVLKAVMMDVYELLKSPIRRCYIITHYCMFITYLLANGMYIWMPAFINDALKDHKQKASICDLINYRYMNNDDDSFIDPHSDEDCAGIFNAMMYPLSMCMELGYLGPYALVLFLINKVNLQKLYASMCVMCCLGLAISALYPQIIVAIISLTFGLSTGCLVSILSALAVEAFPTNLRALAMCTMYMVGQIGAILGVSAIGLMHGSMCYVIFSIIIGGLLSSGIILLTLWPDTSKVREEMESRNFSY